MDEPEAWRQPRPFRFSVQALHAASRRELIDLARRAEDTGFDMLVTPDHLGGPMAPLVALATAAEATRTLRVGTLVLNNDFHHPLLLARDVATLDVLSDGRVELGLGAGHARPEYEAAGLAFDSAGRRIDRLTESVTILRDLLDGKTVAHHGGHYRLSDARCEPRPVQTRVPLLVGGGGDRVLSLGARLADTVGFTGLGRTLADGQHHEPAGFAPRRVDEQVAAVRAAAAGRAAEIELHALVQAVVVTDRPGGAAEALRSRLPELTVEEILATPYVMVGSLASLTEALLERRRRWGFSHYTVRAESLAALAPLVGALAGA